MIFKPARIGAETPWHQDEAYWDPALDYESMSIWVPLQEATVENGCPWILPGAHRGGTMLHRWVDPIGWECFADAPGAVAAEVGAGGIVVFSSLTPHLTGPNTTDDVRKAYIVQYAVDGYVSIAVTALIWWAAGALVRRSAGSGRPPGARKQEAPLAQPALDM